MSPRNEQYLSLCLTQANLSPLHYRHGCIIVRGGKVIGQGYNAYRPGFDGGALKTGVLPASALDGPAIAELKMRLKSKSKSKHKPDCNVPSDTFTPFETVGRQTAGPLSMHSEMMAIQSALSLSSAAQASQTSARGTKYLQKPASKTSRDSKRAKERTKGLKSLTGTGRVLNVPHVDQVSRNEASAEYRHEYLKYEGNENQNQGLAVSPLESAVFNHVDKRSRRSSPDGCHKLQHNNNERSRQPQQNNKGKRSASPRLTIDAAVSLDSALPIIDCAPKKCTSKDRVKAKSPGASSRATGMIRTSHAHKKHNVSSRTKDSRLKGADLYVARLGTPHRSGKKFTCGHDETIEDLQSSAFEISPPTTGSLHDELKVRTPSPRPVSTPPREANPVLQVRESRPCYRCVTYMDSVGIKRVFWTNANGEWEGAKVRDLMDSLETFGEDGENVFVTKHEVLMLMRSMGIH